MKQFVLIGFLYQSQAYHRVSLDLRLIIFLVGVMCITFQRIRLTPRLLAQVVLYFCSFIPIVFFLRLACVNVGTEEVRNLRMSLEIVASIGLFSCATWWFIWNVHNFQGIRVPFILDALRDIYAWRYRHLNEEISRYRNLCWQIVLYAWGIYYALLWYVRDSEDSIVHFSLPSTWFFIFSFSISVLATIFLLFCEVMTALNQRRRRILENTIGFTDPNLTHQGEQEAIPRFGLVFSIFVFGSLIWAPPLILLFLGQ